MTDRRSLNWIAGVNGCSQSPGLSIAEVAEARTSSTIFWNSPMPSCFARLSRRVDNSSAGSYSSALAPSNAGAHQAGSMSSVSGSIRYSSLSAGLHDPVSEHGHFLMTPRPHTPRSRLTELSGRTAPPRGQPARRTDGCGPVRQNFGANFGVKFNSKFGGRCAARTTAGRSPSPA
jgi:hypothetical protein